MAMVWAAKCLTDGGDLKRDRLLSVQELPAAVGGKKAMVPVAEAAAAHKAAGHKAGSPNGEQTNGIVSEHGTMKFVH